MEVTCHFSSNIKVTHDGGVPIAVSQVYCSKQLILLPPDVVLNNVKKETDYKFKFYHQEMGL